MTAFSGSTVNVQDARVAVDAASGTNNRQSTNACGLQPDTVSRLAMAATLACGYLGLVEELEPRPPTRDVDYLAGQNLAAEFGRALDELESCDALRELFGERFTKAYLAAKRAEYTAYFRVIRSWERQYLLLRV